MPIVLQPANSGFNSHLRGSAGEVVGAVAGTGTGGGSVGGSQSAAPVPVLRILYEREVATLSMPHLKSLDIELQVRSVDPLIRRTQPGRGGGWRVCRENKGDESDGNTVSSASSQGGLFQRRA